MVRLLLLGKKRMEEAGEPTPAKIIVADDPQLRLGEDSSTMADTVANFLIDASPKGGVRRIYGYTGDGSNSIATTLRMAGGTEEGEARSHKVVRKRVFARMTGAVDRFE